MRLKGHCRQCLRRFRLARCFALPPGDDLFAPFWVGACCDDVRTRARGILASSSQRLLQHAVEHTEVTYVLDNLEMLGVAAFLSLSIHHSFISIIKFIVIFTVDVTGSLNPARSL